LEASFKGGFNTYTDFQKQITRPGGNSGGGIGSVWESTTRNTEKNFQFVLTTKTISLLENLDLNAIAGAEANDRSYYNSFQNGIGFIVPDIYKMTNTSQQSVTSDYDRSQRILGAFGRLNLSYNNYLFLELTGRNDWTSTLPVDNRSYFYPSAGLSFIFTDALNIKSNILSYGKLRLNAAQTKRDVPPYQLLTTYNVTSPSYLTPGGATIYSASLSNSLKNSNLRPEGVEEFEIGAELNFLNGRIKLDATAYQKTSKDNFVTKRIPVSSGFSTLAINAGSIRNRGYEVGLELVPIKTKSGFSWSVYSAFNLIRSKVLATDDQGADIITGNGAFVANVQRVGQPFGMLYGLASARDDEGNRLIWPGQGGNGGKHIYKEIDDVFGDPNLDFKLGVTNTITYKNITFSALVDWWQGGDMYSITAASLLLRGQLINSVDREGLFVIPGVYGDPDTKTALLDDKGQKIKNTTGISAFDYYFSDGFGAYGPDDTNLYDRTTVRLREVNLGYTVPKEWLKKTPFGSLNVSFSGRNLWFRAPNILPGLNLDPEVLSDVSTSNIQGIDLGAAPSSRRYGVNFRFTF
jgi:outer membrane receptor protein involved in Fe transport